MKFLDAASQPLVGLAAPAGARTFGVRPEHVAVVRDDEAADARLAVDIVERLGGESYAYGALQDGAPFCVRASDALAARRGDALGLRFDRARLHWFGADDLALGA